MVICLVVSFSTLGPLRSQADKKWKKHPVLAKKPNQSPACSHLWLGNKKVNQNWINTESTHSFFFLMSIPSGKRFINIDQVRSTQVRDEENSCGFNSSGNFFINLRRSSIHLEQLWKFDTWNIMKPPNSHLLDEHPPSSASSPGPFTRFHSAVSPSWRIA